MPQLKPHVYIFMGLIASGKSTLAEAFATRHQLRYYNSDVERKKLAKVARTARGTGGFARGIYTPEFSRLTYDVLMSKAKDEVAHGCSVVLDGSYAKQADRHNIIGAFGDTGATVVFILCEVSELVTKQRLQLRALDESAVSDGTYEIYSIQKKGFEYPDEPESTGFITIETDGDVEQLLTTIESSLNIPPFRSTPKTNS